MNAIDILKQMMGGSSPAGKSPGGGGGGGVFKDIFSGGSAGGGRQASPDAPLDIERSARELEDMLGVGREGGRAAPPAVPEQPTNWSIPAPGRIPPPLPRRETPSAAPGRQDQEAVVLIRAMIQAAKADGRLTSDEQRAILQRIGSSPDARRFIENEFRTDTNVRDFAWSVPLGLESKVYAISLAAITLDTQAESDYLRELGHGLRLSDDDRGEIHRRFGIPAPAP